ncbi:MAG: ferritin family protein [Deltaproteobacteria bacterium]|nr:ferritin family protein [Deltaproteobacteria bacterium]
MSNFGSVDEVLNFAIEREQEAVDFYSDLAGKVDQEWMKKIFQNFAAEEKGHKAKLEGIKEGKKLFPAEKKIQDLKIGDYLVEESPTPDMSYQDALILAMKKEKKAFRLYMDLSEQVDDPDLQSTFLALAQEEAKHKLRFEVEYDDHVLKEN